MIAVLVSILSSFLVSTTVVVIRYLKDIHWVIINTTYGIFLTIFAIVLWAVYRIALGNMVEYNFDWE